MGNIVLISDSMPNLLPMGGRSHGIHVSEIIHDICVRMGHYQPRAEDTVWNQAQLELGNAFEHAIIERLSKHEEEHAGDDSRFLKPGELELDGIFGTPDLLDVLDEIVHEFKCTWASSRHGDDEDHDGPKLWKYWTQIKCYCSMMGWTTGRLHVMFINGNYKRDDVRSGPQYRCWEQQFTKTELDLNWRVMLRTAECLAKARGIPFEARR